MIQPINPVSSFWGANSAYGVNSTLNLDNLGNININKPRINRNRQNRQNGVASLHLHNVPEALAYLTKKIWDHFKIKIKNSDIGFSEEELKYIYYGLSILPIKHLLGIKTIVKNKSIQLNKESIPKSILAKQHKNRTYGAYDQENKTVYIFELDNPKQILAVLKHEVGHAVHSNNMNFRDFFLFALKSGWNVAYHEQCYIPSNELYNIGMTKVFLSKKEALEIVDYFDWDSLIINKDKVNRYILAPPQKYRDIYAYKNPYETFAVLYEKTH